MEKRSTERDERVMTVVAAALRVPAAERDSLLHIACQGDAELYREVTEVVEWEERMGSFLSEPLIDFIDFEDLDRPFRIGEVISERFEIMREAGAGGMGVVYKALDLKLHRPVALKFLPELLSRDPAALERFRREARAASALNHPGICTIHDIGEHEGKSFIVMELLEGSTLAQHIGSKPLPVEKILSFGVDIADALAAAHARGIIHRDIKPANIFVTQESRMKLLDFGLAKLQPQQAMAMGAVEFSTAADLTGTGVPLGTIVYMSPEQARGQELDARTDLFSFGTVLYEMATGTAAFGGKTLAEIHDGILNRPPTALTAVNPKIHPRLQEIVEKCLEKDPRMRCQSAAEIRTDLQRLRRDTNPDVAASARREASSDARPRPTTRRRAVAFLVVLSLSIAAVAAYFYLRPGQGEAIDSVAVLPFANAGADPKMDYLSDGITESLINNLSQLPNLRVMARSTVFRYKGTEEDPQKIGQLLHVRAVLSGRLLQRGDVLIVRAELMEVAKGSQLWGGQYNRTSADVFTLQEDLAKQISDKLRLRLSGEEKQRLTKRYTENAEAYQLYLKGLYFWNQRTPRGNKNSIDFFQQAVEKDPNFALAYAGMADAYNFSNILGVVSLKDSSPQAEAAATKALALDPLLAEAHAALGTAKSHYHLDFPGAQREFLRAIELNPNYAIVRVYYSGAYLTPMGRHQEAIFEMKKALELDPLSSPVNTMMGKTYLWAGDYEKSLQQFQRTIGLDPTFPLAHVYFASLLQEMGRYEEAIAEYEKGALLFGASPKEAGARAAEFRKALQTRGPQGYWQKNLEVALKEHGQAGSAYSPAYALAGAYARAGDKENAFRWLGKSYEEREDVTSVRWNPDFKGLRGDPRFADLLKRMGLPQ